MLHTRAQGYFTWVVLNEKGELINYAPKYSRNLILNSGLNGVASRSWADSFTVCAVGTGDSLPNVEQSTLDIEAARTGNYLNEPGANSTTAIGATLILRRTFVFSATLPTGTYKEAGFSHSMGGVLFSRVLLPNIPIVLGQTLIIQYELAVTVSPSNSLSIASPIFGATSSGEYKYQLFGLKGVNSLGASYNYDSGAGCNEPSVSAALFLSPSSDSLAPIGSSVDRSSGAFQMNLGFLGYDVNSFTRVKTAVISRASAQGNWGSIGVGATTNPSINTGAAHVFDSPFVKGDGTFRVYFRWTWGAGFAVDRITSLHYWQDEDSLFLLRANLLLQYFGQIYD